MYRQHTAPTLTVPLADTTTQTTQTNVNSIVQYICLYRTARLTYSATLVSTP